MLAHHTISGCNIETGDLLGSGTISGTDANSRGSLLEQSNGGKDAIEIGQELRRFLEDGDQVVIRGFCTSGELRLGFGTCAGQIDAAKPLL